MLLLSFTYILTINYKLSRSLTGVTINFQFSQKYEKSFLTFQTGLFVNITPVLVFPKIVDGTKSFLGIYIKAILSAGK